MRKAQILMNKPVYVGLSISDLSKSAMFGFWYNHVKPKYGENPKLYYMDRGSFIVHVKMEDIYKYIAEDIETRFETSSFELGRPLPKEKYEKVIGLMKEFVGLRAKTFLKSKKLYKRQQR